MCQIPAKCRPDELPFLRVSSLASMPMAVMRAISGPQGCASHARMALAVVPCHRCCRCCQQRGNRGSQQKR